MKRVLISCEYSGIVRKAFSNRGFEAWSCDLLDSEIDPQEEPGHHVIGNVLSIINEGWDLMIAFPPCTYLTYAGMRNWYDKGRAEKRIKAAEFFMRLYNSNIDRVAIENPRGIMSEIFRKPDQVIHPYYFGEPHLKRTCLWLKNLPPLTYKLETDLFGEATAVTKPEPISIDKVSYRKKNRYFTDSSSGGHSRSKSFASIANAMAEQWGTIINSI